MKAAGAMGIKRSVTMWFLGKISWKCSLFILGEKIINSDFNELCFLKTGTAPRKLYFLCGLNKKNLCVLRNNLTDL